jgi:hypothetical protein
MNDQYYARGNACMHQHHQAKIQDFSSQTGYQKIPIDMACEMANSVIGKQGELLEY